MTNVTKAVETTETTKAARITVNSCLFTAHPEVLEGAEKVTKEQIDAHVEANAVVLANLLIGKGSAEYTVADKIWKAAMKQIPALVKAKAAEEAEALAAKEEAKAAAAKAQAEADKVMAEKREEIQQAMVNALVAGGMSLEVAMNVAKVQLLGSTKAKAAYDRVIVEYKGETFEMPTKGNQSKQVKDALKETGLDVQKFIETYQVKEAA